MSTNDKNKTKKINGSNHNGSHPNTMEEYIDRFLRQCGHLMVQERFSTVLKERLEKKNFQMFVDGTPVSEDTEISFVAIPVIPKPTYKELEARIKELEGKVGDEL